MIPTIRGNAWSCAKGRIQRIARKGVSFIGVRCPPSRERRGRQPRGRQLHPQVYKEGRFSLDLQWFRRILDWAGDEFQPQRYPFADRRSTTKVKRPEKRAGVWVNTPKGGAAVKQGLNKPWHNDSIFVMCPHKLLQQVEEKAILEGSRGIMIVPRHKNKEWVLGLGGVTVDWWGLPHDALCFRDEGDTPRSPGKLGAQAIIFDACRGDQEELGQTDLKKSHVDPPPQDHRNRPGRRSNAWSEIWEASTKTKSHAPPCVTSSRRPVGMSRKAWKVQRVSAAARGLIPLPPDSILNSILPRSAVMSQEHVSILDPMLPCSTVMSHESMTELRAQKQEHSLEQLVERVCIEQNCGNPLPSSDLPEVCEPQISKVSFVHPRTKKVSPQDRISDWSKGLGHASPSKLTSEESQTLSVKANDRPLPFSGISGDPVTIFRTRDRCVCSVIEADAEHPHCQGYRNSIYNRFKDWSEIEKNMNKRGPNGICVLEPIPGAKPKADKPIRAVGFKKEAMREKIED